MARSIARSAGSKRWDCSRAGGKIHRLPPAKIVPAGGCTRSPRPAKRPPWRRAGRLPPPSETPPAAGAGMTAPLFALAVAVLRAWTHVYTWRLDPVLRERRRAEIESDLWEFQQDPAGNRGLSPALQVLARTVGEFRMISVGVPTTSSLPPRRNGESRWSRRQQPPSSSRHSGSSRLSSPPSSRDLRRLRSPCICAREAPAAAATATTPAPPPLCKPPSLTFGCR